MTRETLYDLAFRFKKTKLWKKLHETQVFAARTETGETVFICIMGEFGEHTAISVYPEEDFYTYYKFLDADRAYEEQAPYDILEILIQASFIQCSFENRDQLEASDLEEVRTYARSHGIRLRGAGAYPWFRRFTPYHMPWHVTSDRDLSLLAAGLEASAALSDILEKDPGFAGKLRSIDAEHVSEVPVFAFTEKGYVPDGTVPLPGRWAGSFPEGSFEDEGLLNKIRKKRRGGTIECRVFWLNDPVRESPDVVPCYPAALMAVEESGGAVVHCSVVKNYETDHDELLSQFMTSLAERKKRPARVLAQNERTYALLAGTMEKISADLEVEEDLPGLEEAMSSLYDHMSRGEEADVHEPGGPEVIDRVDREFTRVLSELEAMDDRHLFSLPMDVKLFLSAVADEPWLSPSQKASVENLLSRMEGTGQGPRAGSRGRAGSGTKKKGRGRRKAMEPLSYVISISPYAGCYRHIRLSADNTLDDLHEIIQSVFRFDNDHLYAFFMDNRKWSRTAAYFSPHYDAGPCAADFLLRDFSLSRGQKFLYLFDFGDEWTFSCRVLRVLEEDTRDFDILRSKGDVPGQYPDDGFDVEFYDEDEEEEDPD